MTEHTMEPTVEVPKKAECKPPKQDKQEQVEPPAVVRGTASSAGDPLRDDNT